MSATSEPVPLWTGTCRSRFAVPTAIVFFIAAVILAVVVHPFLGLVGSLIIAVVVVLGGIAVLAVTQIRATVTPEALVIGYATPGGWPRTRLPIAEIERVQHLQVDPVKYGGWGYRGSLRLYRRAALNLRRGDGLRLDLQGGRIFVLTVDDAAGAVAAISSLLDGSPQTPQQPRTGTPLG